MRGTKWLVQDTCTTTLTRVVQGVVEVNDFVKKKKALIKKGKRYIARPEEEVAQASATPAPRRRAMNRSGRRASSLLRTRSTRSPSASSSA